MLRTLLFSVLSLALGAASTARADLPAPVAKALERARIPQSAVSVVVEEVGPAAAGTQKKAVLRHRPTASMNPASVMKLVTTVAALETLGPNWKWKTPVYVEGDIRDGAEGGVLHGNLYIEGRGDPKLVAERIWLLLRRVQGLGIRAIEGDIVLDAGAFETGPHDPAEFDGEPLRPYNAAPDALLLSYKSVIMTFTPDAAANVARLHVEPPLAGVQWPASVPLAEGHCGDWRGALKAEFSRPEQPVFKGRYPAACEEKIWPLAYADPDSYNARAIRGMWESIGGRLHGLVRAGKVPAELKERGAAFALESPPLAEVVRDINKYSNNVMTQQLFLTLSLEQQGLGTPQASRDLLQAWWKERFGATDMPRVNNGSGLSRDDRTSAAALARLLHYAWNSPFMPELVTSLPISGQDGTLRPERWKAEGNAHLKTGSLRDVASIAGIVHGKNGRRHVLVMLVNHPNAHAAKPALESLVDWTATQAGQK